MLAKLLHLETHTALLGKVETVILICLNGFTIGMIDWVKDIAVIFDSVPALLLTGTVILLNLAKAYQIFIDTLIKKKQLKDGEKTDNTKD